MKKRLSDSLWIPLWIDKWIFGSMRIEHTPEERGIWIDLLAIAAKDNGFIRANEEIPYPIQQLAGMLLIPEKILESAIEKFIKTKKIERYDNGILRIINWEKYQLSQRHKRRFKQEMAVKSDTMSAKTDTMSEFKDPISYHIKSDHNQIKSNQIKSNKNEKSSYRYSLCLKKITETDKRLTQLLIDLMLENDPQSSIIRRLTKKRQIEWIDACRKLREIDKRPPELIEKIIRFSQQDEFWHKNILSMPKLREKFDQLYLKARKTDYSGIRQWLKEKMREDKK